MAMSRGFAADVMMSKKLFFNSVIHVFVATLLIQLCYHFSSNYFLHINQLQGHDNAIVMIMMRVSNAVSQIFSTCTDSKGTLFLYLVPCHTLNE